MPRRATTPTRILTGAAAGLLAAALLPALPAAAEQAWPADAWPVCADDAATYCIAAATLTPVGGQPAPLDEFGLTATTETVGESLRWAVDGWAGQPDNVTGGHLALVLRTGSWVPRFTNAAAEDLRVTTTTDEQGDNTLHITGRATHVDWASGDVTGDPDEMADPDASGPRFSGTTSDTDALANGGYVGDGAYLTTDAQTAPMGFEFADWSEVPHLGFHGFMRNPHLDADGHPVRGSLTVWLPESWFTTRDTTAQEAVETGFDLVDTNTQTSLPITVTPRDGGVELSTDALDYGSPYLRIYLQPSGADGQSAPEAPQDVHATTGPGTITASWTEPDDDGGSPLTGYTVRAFTEPEGGTVAGRCAVVPADDDPEGSDPEGGDPEGGDPEGGDPEGGDASEDGDDTSCAIEGLTEDQTYYLAVSASNALGESPAQDERYEVTASAPTAPSAPTNVRVGAGKGSLTAAWNEPESDHGAPVTGYTARAYRAASGGEPVSTCTAGPEARACVLKNLAKGVPYFVGVAATNSAGQGPANAVRVKGTPWTTPGTPRNVGVTPGRKKVQVSWAVSASSGGTPVTGYRVRVYTARSGGSVAEQCTTKATVRTCTLAGLAGGRSYWVSTAALNAVGPSTETARIKVTIRR
ncbi:fibronectin type III domain protein [Krasilnikovia cinnamomea]|uniref:Fibronectin type III domain protein n=1 Tax=Krasilnikovia cinnamomea TaxID=349313 RepID=A0A4Q7ZUI6_9ACTN|nr:fibronectin type III domain-containing protein [Krasilnikovia cinnamomea]RZU54245.1 fibronectin type III domain protein [Krasilnikovia cinnamomea]